MLVLVALFSSHEKTVREDNKFQWSQPALHFGMTKEKKYSITRDGSRAAATSKIERFVIIVNGFQQLTIITKRSILDVSAALDPPLTTDNSRRH